MEAEGKNEVVDDTEGRKDVPAKYELVIGVMMDCLRVETDEVECL